LQKKIKKLKFGRNQNKRHHTKKHHKRHHVKKHHKRHHAKKLPKISNVAKKVNFYRQVTDSQPLIAHTRNFYRIIMTSGSATTTPTTPTTVTAPKVKSTKATKKKLIFTDKLLIHNL